MSLSADQALQRLKRHMLWLLVAFFVALSYFAGRSLEEKLEERTNARLIQAWTETSIAFNQLVHELQKERGMTSGFLSSAGRSFGAELQAQQRQTDQAIGRMHAAAATLPAEAGVLAALTRETLSRLDRLGDLRHRIGDRRLAREAAIEHYNELVAQMFDHLLTTVSVGRFGWIVRPQIAFLFFVRAKEMAGQERALLTAMLTAKDFGREQIAAHQRIKALEQSSAGEFMQLADATAGEEYRAILGQPFIAETERIRRLVAAVSAGGRAAAVKLPDAQTWFALSSKKIDALSGFETAFSERLLDSAGKMYDEAQQSLVLSAIAAFVSFALALALIVQIRRGKNLAENHLLLAEEVFSNSVEAIVVADAEGDIIDVNPAFTRITGYTRAEAIGQNPRLLSSGRHDAAFYRTFWQSLRDTSSWEGEIWNRRKDGAVFPALLSVAAVKNTVGEISHFIATIGDLSKFKETEALVEQLRTFDALTGLPNRAAWHSAVDQAVDRAQRTDGRFAVLDIGLDRFSKINESFGHAVGDQVLTAAAVQIKLLLGGHEVAARQSGNHFAILLPDVAGPEEVASWCERLLAAFMHPLKTASGGFNQSITIGAALYPTDGGDTRTLLQNAESALHAARIENGGSGYLFYSAEMNATGAKLLALEQMMRQALARNEFSLAYQPQVAAGDGRLLGVEALIRWQNPELGAVSPVQFIPIAETTGLIVTIGEWVLRTACRQAQAWRDEFGADIQVAVNLSARQFGQADLLATVQQALDDSGLPARLLELEITEGSLMHDPAGATIVMQGLRNMGIKLALDDFGTGYSSLAYLKHFPLDRLKLDRAFVIDLVANEYDQAIAQGVISLGHVLHMDVLAEGVETAEQGKLLGAYGCDVFQGYLFGRPMTAAQLDQELRAGRLVALSAESPTERPASLAAAP